MNTDVPTDRGGIVKGAGLYKDKEVEKRVGGKIFNLSVPNFKALSMSLSSVADFLWGEGEYKCVRLTSPNDSGTSMG